MGTKETQLNSNRFVPETKHLLCACLPETKSGVCVVSNISYTSVVVAIRIQER